MMRLARHDALERRDVGDLTLAILLFDDVEVLDFAGPFEVFSVTAGFLEGRTLEVSTVAESHGEIRALGGLTVRPDRTTTETPPPNVLVVPGGDGTRREMDNRDLVAWVKDVHDSADVILSVCSGARILARAGLLDGLPVTTHHQVIGHLRELAPRARVKPGVRYIDAGRIVTSGGISAGIDASFHVVTRLFGRDVARAAANYMEYDWRPVAASRT